MTSDFVFDPCVTQQLDKIKSTAPMSRFDKQAWSDVRAHAQSLRDLGSGTSVIEVHSITGGTSLGVVIHDRVPGSKVGCIWSRFPEALLIERRLKDDRLGLSRQRPPQSQSLLGYVLIANPHCASQCPTPMGLTKKHIELHVYEREFWLIAPTRSIVSDPTGERYLGYWQPMSEQNKELIVQADDKGAQDQAPYAASSAPSPERQR